MNENKTSMLLRVTAVEQSPNRVVLEDEQGQRGALPVPGADVAWFAGNFGKVIRFECEVDEEDQG